MISTTADLPLQSLNSKNQQVSPQVNLDRDISLLIGTYYTCHSYDHSGLSLGLDEIAAHVFLVNGGCKPCLQHFYKTKDSFSRICQIG